ncbi:acylphosphatase [archaeon]|nr:acylphosphatase [archaeon]
MKRAHIVISGLVTGVGYRSYARNYANDLGLKGFVRNTKSGKVEIVIEGYDTEIQKFLQVLRKGSWGAKVEDIDVSWEDPTNEFEDFKILV